MSHIDIKSLEQYLLVSDKTTFLEKLINGTDPYYYFTLNHALNTYGLNLPKESMEDFENYKLIGTPRSQNIILRYSFLQLAKPNENQEKRKAILKDINERYFFFNFHFEEPHIASSKAADASKQEINNVLEEKIIDFSPILEKCYQDENSFNSLKDEALQFLDLAKITNSANKNIGNAFLTRAFLAEFQGIEEFIHNVFLKNPSYQLEKKHYQQMTLDQLKKLGKLITDLMKSNKYIAALFQKEFETDLNENHGSFSTVAQKLQRQKKLLKMGEWVKNLPHKNQCFLGYFLCEYLNLGIQINVFDFDVFIDYLKNPIRVYSQANAQQKELISSSGRSYSDESFWRDLSQTNYNHWVNDIDLINIYLENYFKINKKIEPFDEFLESTSLNELFYKVRLYEGDQINNITEILSVDVLKRLHEEKILTICKFNSEYFESNEEINLYLEIKNVTDLTIKIFEISTEDYYLKKSCEIVDDVNVDGLIANEEIFFEFTDPPQKKVVKEFKFTALSQKKRGVFIIDFLGNGLSSRALIRKGRLMLLEKASLSGQIFTILDEELEICSKSSRTGIWVKGRFHETNENGQVNLPFSKTSESSVPAIIVHGTFASLTTITLIEEKYDFKCSYLYKDESLIMGNKMKVLIQPKLYLNQQHMNLDIIQNQTIIVVSRADNDIPSTMVFDKIKFDYKQEIELEIPIPAKLNSIKIEVKGKIKKMISSNNQDLDLFHSHDITLNNYINDDKFCGLYLRYTMQNYEIYVFGKNGEPKSHVVLTLEFRNKYLENSIITQLQTDSEGKFP